jgi:hypothetical protein
MDHLISKLQMLDLCHDRSKDVCQKGIWIPLFNALFHNIEAERLDSNSNSLI